MSEHVSIAVSRRAECGEGPVWDPTTGAVHWVDIIAGEILLTDFASGETRVTRYPEMVGAVAPRSAAASSRRWRAGSWGSMPPATWTVASTSCPKASG